MLAVDVRNVNEVTTVSLEQNADRVENRKEKKEVGRGLLICNERQQRVLIIENTIFFQKKIQVTVRGRKR